MWLVVFLFLFYCMVKKIFLSQSGAQDRRIFFRILFVYFSFMEWNSATQHKVSSILLDCLYPFQSEFQLRGSGHRHAVLMFRTRDFRVFYLKQNGWEGQTSSLAVWALQAAVAGVGACGVYRTDVAVCFFSLPPLARTIFLSACGLSLSGGHLWVISCLMTYELTYCLVPLPHR